jgi:signal transduction histidine kinase/ABC-type uncharacterized transport system substrate-binding protein
MSLTSGTIQWFRTASSRAARSLAIALGLGVVLSADAAAQERFRTNVLAIHSGAVDYLSNPVVDAGIREGLQPGATQSIGYFSEFLEFDRFPEVGASPELAEYIRRKYAGRRIDLVIAATSRSLNFVLEHRPRLFPNAPIVFMAAVEADDSRLNAPGVTGLRFGAAYAATLGMIARFHPSASRVHIVAISPNRAQVDAIRGALEDPPPGVQLEYVKATTLPELISAVREIPRDGVVLYVTFQQQGTNYILDPREAARRVAAAAKVPVYGVVDAMIGTGIVGGMVRDSRGTGVRAGEMARRILGGVSTMRVPPADAPLNPVFDWRQLQRWRVDLLQLPTGSDVRFRVPPAWEAYRLEIVAATVVLGAQLALIAALLTQHARRQRAEEALRKREATLRTSYGRIRQLAGGLIHAQEGTRVQIARDLHDDICQELIGVAMSINSLAGTTGRIQDPRAQYSIAKLHRWALTLADRVRQISHELHPATLQLLGLAAALRTHCAEAEKRYDVQVSFDAAAQLGDIPASVSLPLFRIAQEALRNGAVHGKARRIRVSLTRVGESIELAVSDDGSGFDVEAVRRDGRGLGLVSMEERARLAGGEVLIVSRPSRGTAVLVRVPMPESAEREEAAVPLQVEEEASCQTVALQ